MVTMEAAKDRCATGGSKNWTKCGMEIAKFSAMDRRKSREACADYKATKGSANRERRVSPDEPGSSGVRIEGFPPGSCSCIRRPRASGLATCIVR